jgi:hypothetical protein
MQMKTDGQKLAKRVAGGEVNACSMEPANVLCLILLRIRLEILKNESERMTYFVFFLKKTC